MDNRNVKKICVFAASSSRAPQTYLDAAEALGTLLARNNITVVYGGGSVGLMGKLADGALAQQGKVIGIIPKFMVELEWARSGLTELVIVNDMHERKAKMIDGTDAVIALPGGSGTLEELLEVITLKRLGLYTRPVIIVNTSGYYDQLIDLFARSVNEELMDERHLSMWSVVQYPSQVLEAIQSATGWSEDARKFAAL